MVKIKTLEEIEKQLQEIRNDNDRLIKQIESNGERIEHNNRKYNELFDEFCRLSSDYIKIICPFCKNGIMLIDLPNGKKQKQQCQFCKGMTWYWGRKYVDEV